MDLRLTGHKGAGHGRVAGIGEGLAHVFAGEDCDLLPAARSTRTLARAAADARDRYGVDVRTFPLDLTATGAANHVMAHASEANVLANNAGSIPGGSLLEIDEAASHHGWKLKTLGCIS